MKMAQLLRHLTVKMRKEIRVFSGGCVAQDGFFLKKGDDKYYDVHIE